MLKRLIIVCLLLLSALPSAGQEPPAGTIAVVSSPLANVREDGEPKSPIATQVLLGDGVRILEKVDYRYRIAIPSQGDREGWIHQEALLIPRDNGKSFFKIDRPWIVVSAPKTFALILDRLGNHNISLYGGTRLPVQEKTADGYKVLFPDRTVAVISASDATPFKPYDAALGGPEPADLGAIARKFNGARVLAGGITVQGMDTRGLIYAVYRIAGIDLDAEPAALASRGVKVAKKEIQAGDILVFHGEGLGLSVGNDRFLHAVRKTTIQLGGVHDRRYANSLLYGLRLVNAEPAAHKLPSEMTADEIMTAQLAVADLPLDRRIVYWAGKFIGTPYDPDPLGLYVRTNRIVADEKVDCMYLTFRTVELATSTTPGEAIDRARDLRFRTKGVVKDGVVQNYADRYDYGEDMVWSGKWGRNITEELGRTRTIEGSRGRDEVTILPKAVLATKRLQKELQDGDIVYWVKDPRKRVVGEIVAHLSFVHIKNNKPYLIHASGSKDNGTRPGGGEVKEVSFADYVRHMKFIGAFVTRIGG